jgi:hypothetical protein
MNKRPKLETKNNREWPQLGHFVSQPDGFDTAAIAVTGSWKTNFVHPT